MRRSTAIGAAAAIATVAAVALFGTGGQRAAPDASAGSPPGDLTRLVEQFSAAPTASVVRRLEAQARSTRGGPGSLALLGLGYQQLFRETADPSWLTRASAALVRARSGAPSDPLAATGLAQLAVTQHRFHDGEALARKALQLDPASTVARGALGDALLNLGRYPAAFAEYDRLAAAGPSVAAYSRVAFARQLTGRRRAALDAMELALEAGTGIPEQEAWARVQYGTMLLAVGRTRDAESAFRRALALSPGYVHAEAGLARVDAARGLYERSASRLRSVNARLPSPQYAILLADVLRRAGRLHEAKQTDALVDVLERVLAANGVRTELSTAIHDLDRGVRIHDALARARSAYAAAPSVAAADAVSWGLYRARRCDEARGWALTAARLGTNEPLFAFHRGMIERCLGHDVAAHTQLRRALRLDRHFSLRWAPVAGRLSA